MPDTTSRAELIEFLPHALTSAIKGYNALLEKKKNAPNVEKAQSALNDENNNNSTQQNSQSLDKDFAVHQAALKSAIINIELIYKLIERVAAKAGAGDTEKIMQQMLLKSELEIKYDKDTYGREDD